MGAKKYEGAKEEVEEKEKRKREEVVVNGVVGEMRG